MSPTSMPPYAETFNPRRGGISLRAEQNSVRLVLFLQGNVMARLKPDYKGITRTVMSFVSLVVSGVSPQLFGITYVLAFSAGRGDFGSEIANK